MAEAGAADEALVMGLRLAEGIDAAALERAAKVARRAREGGERAGKLQDAVGHLDACVSRRLFQARAAAAARAR